MAIKLNREGVQLSADERNKRNKNWEIIEDESTEMLKKVTELNETTNKRVDGIVIETGTEAFNQVVSSAAIEWKEPVATFADLVTIYPKPEEGWASQTTSDGAVYRYDGSAWKKIQQVDAGPVNALDTRLTAQLTGNAEEVEKLVIETDEISRKISGRKNVRSFGSSGDGVTDDWEALQNAINSIGMFGGEIYLPNGVYRYTKELNVLNNNIGQPYQLSLIGESRKGVTLLFDPPSGSGNAIKYDNGATVDQTSPTKHSLKMRNIVIKHTKEIEQYMSWFAGVGLYLAGLRNSTFENVNVDGFEMGILNIRGYLNEFRNVYIDRCKKGLRSEATAYVNLFERVTLNRCGSNLGDSDNYGMYIKDAGGVTLINCTIEIHRGSAGLTLEGVNGFTINGMNFENLEQTHAIRLLGSGDLSNEGNWTSGGVINGIRLWKTFGVTVGEGVKDISIRALTFLTDSAWSPTTTVTSIHSPASADKSKIRNVDYSGCSYLPNPGTHPILHKDSSGASGYAFKSFTENGKRYANSRPSGYGQLGLKKGDIVYNNNVSAGGYLGWVCTDDVLNVWKGFGLIEV